MKLKIISFRIQSQYINIKQDSSSGLFYIYIGHLLEVSVLFQNRSNFNFR